ncbi:MAG: hypothetical protein WA491_17590, partial [Candidatus Acidiferrum sp.]
REVVDREVVDQEVADLEAVDLEVAVLEVVVLVAAAPAEDLAEVQVGLAEPVGEPGRVQNQASG